MHFFTRTLNILGNVVSEGEIRPDPDRMKALYYVTLLFELLSNRIIAPF